jgi:D-arabinono-1,4-lactone oxidase/FAD binding domain
MMIRSMVRQFFYTNLNTLLYVLSFGKYHWLEGRYQRGRFHNWSHQFWFHPSSFDQPSSENAIVDLIKRYGKVRVVGAGHSFNPAFVTNHAVLSLDKYAGIVDIDRHKMEVTVLGGTRIRDISRLLWKQKLALIALPSHDAQSIAGLLSTDTHGTGRQQGFVSQSVMRLKIVDAHGDVLECAPDDDLFRATIGGIGAIGVIIEVVLRVVERFNIETVVKIVDVDDVMSNLETYRASHDHFSLYMFPFSNKCQINTWDRTDKRRSFLGSQRQDLVWAVEGFLATTVVNAVVFTGMLPRVSTLLTRLRPNITLVLRSYQAFHHTLYYVSQSNEFAFSADRTLEIWRELNGLYEQTWRKSSVPFLVFDVRFTPAGHDRTLIGPGRGRESTFIDLLMSPTTGYEKFYAAAEAIQRASGGRPHLGKYTGTFDSRDLARSHGKHFDRFVELVQRHDPNGKFQTAFSQRFLSCCQ